MKKKEVDKRVTEKLKENIEMLLISSEMEVDAQTKDDTQSQTNIQNTVDPQNNFDTQAKIDTQTKIDTQIKIDTQTNIGAQNNVDEPKNDDCFRLDFEVLLCPDFNFKEGQDMLLIAAGYPWSNFEEPVVTMKFFKRVAADYIHFKVFKLVQLYRQF